VRVRQRTRDNLSYRIAFAKIATRLRRGATNFMGLKHISLDRETYRFLSVQPSETALVLSANGGEAGGIKDARQNEAFPQEIVSQL